MATCCTARKISSTPDLAFMATSLARTEDRGGLMAEDARRKAKGQENEKERAGEGKEWLQLNNIVEV